MNSAHGFDPGGVKRARARRKLKPNEARATNKAGLHYLAIRTHREVAEIMGCTPERVRQIERDALYKIRNAMKHFNPFKEGLL